MRKARFCCHNASLRVVVEPDNQLLREALEAPLFSGRLGSSSWESASYDSSSPRCVCEECCYRKNQKTIYLVFHQSGLPNLASSASIITLVIVVPCLFASADQWRLKETGTLMHRLTLGSGSAIPPLYPVTVRIFIWFSGVLAYRFTRKEGICLAALSWGKFIQDWMRPYHKESPNLSRSRQFHQTGCVLQQDEWFTLASLEQR